MKNLKILWVENVPLSLEPETHIGYIENESPNNLSKICFAILGISFLLFWEYRSKSCLEIMLVMSVIFSIFPEVICVEIHIITFKHYI